MYVPLNTKLPGFDFPQSFVFGAATAPYQIEGSCFDGCGPCHWDTFSATPSNVVRAEDGALACDHHNRWPADLDLLKAARMDSYRLSSSWARVMPDGRHFKPEGLVFHEYLVDGMLERGLKPFQTLDHSEMPLAVSDLGGWTNRDLESWYADFAEVAMRRLGDRVEAVATINEPWEVAWLSHFMGIHAPGHSDIRAAAHAIHDVLLAHGAAVERLRGMRQKNLGSVLNFDHTDPASKAPEDVAAADRWDSIFNHWFIKGITRKSYPRAVLDGLSPHIPQGWEADMDLIGQKLDWLGVKYYTRNLMAYAPGTASPLVHNVSGYLDNTKLGWEIHPAGLENFLVRMSRNCVGDVPIHATENGMANAEVIDPGAVNDAVREDYLFAHLAATRRAIDQATSVKGFFCWSLQDNYEWAGGYDKRFGIVHVDFESQVRTPKASYHAMLGHWPGTNEGALRTRPGGFLPPGPPESICAWMNETDLTQTCY